MNRPASSQYVNSRQDIGSSPSVPFAFEAVIDDICRMRWQALTTGELMQTAKAYYYFSIQFRENLEIACRLYPEDRLLQKLREGECDTDNLSPWPGVSEIRERLDHDEFMRRLLSFESIAREGELSEIGQAYLATVRTLDNTIRAASIASYEDGGLTRVFNAILRAREWQGAGPAAFKFFLEQHIEFDTADCGGHGALARNLVLDDGITPLWSSFRDMLVAAVPALLPEGSRNAGGIVAKPPNDRPGCGSPGFSAGLNAPTNV
jgi:hypothetical protein